MAAPYLQVVPDPSTAFPRTPNNDVTEELNVAEIWVECDVCQRRYYWEREAARAGQTPHCPVCGSRSPGSATAATEDDDGTAAAASFFARIGWQPQASFA